MGNARRERTDIMRYESEAYFQSISIMLISPVIFVILCRKGIQLNGCISDKGIEEARSPSMTSPDRIAIAAIIKIAGSGKQRARINNKRPPASPAKCFHRKLPSNNRYFKKEYNGSKESKYGSRVFFIFEYKRGDNTKAK